jgi:hypothetical protein
MKLEYYKTALHNIQLARDNGYPKSKLGKLTEREQRCLNKIRAGECLEDGFQKHGDAKKKMLSPTLPANEKFPFCYVADCLYLDKSDEFGYHIRTKEDLKVGTIVAAERHLVSGFDVPDQKTCYERCDYCMSRSLLNLFPCNSCVGVMYCSEKCRQEAFESYHKYMCGSDQMCSGIASCMHKLFFFGLKCFKSVTKFAKFLKKIENTRVNAWDMDFRGLNQKEINKKLFQAVYCYKSNNPQKPEKNFINNFKQLAAFTALVFKNPNFKDILATEELKDMFRNFAFRLSTLVNYHYSDVIGYAFCANTSDTQFTEPSGVGILTLTHYFNHSCAPNVHQFYDDSKTYFVVMRPIKKGEQLLIEYGRQKLSHLFKTVEERQKDIMALYNFKCECEACKNPNKYPLHEDLKLKDLDFIRLQAKLPIKKIMVKNNVDAALEHYGSICRYLDESNHYYPSKGIFTCKAVFKKCVQTFCTFDDYKDF